MPITKGNAVAAYLAAAQQKKEYPTGVDETEFGNVVAKNRDIFEISSTETPQIKTSGQSQTSHGDGEEEEQEQPEQEQDQEQDQEQKQDQDQLINKIPDRLPKKPKIIRVIRKLNKDEWTGDKGNPGWYGEDGLKYYYDERSQITWRFDPINDRWTWRAKDGLYHYMLDGDETWIGHDGVEHWYDKRRRKRTARKVTLTVNGETVERNGSVQTVVTGKGRRVHVHTSGGRTKKSRSKKYKKKSKSLKNRIRMNR